MGSAVLCSWARGDAERGRRSSPSRRSLSMCTSPADRGTAPSTPSGPRASRRRHVGAEVGEARLDDRLLELGRRRADAIGTRLDAVPPSSTLTRHFFFRSRASRAARVAARRAGRHIPISTSPSSRLRSRHSRTQQISETARIASEDEHDDGGVGHGCRLVFVAALAVAQRSGAVVCRGLCFNGAPRRAENSAQIEISTVSEITVASPRRGPAAAAGSPRHRAPSATAVHG